jgi:hypothetical protein
VTRFVDHGAVVAAYVGIGMAVVVAVSFLLVIPIEPIYWALAIPAGLLIGYYANQRSDRRAGPISRILGNGLFAVLVTGVALAVLLLAVKALFFVADNGYRDENLGGSITCQTGADCVYQRYLADGRRSDLEAAGVSDVAAFSRFYWNQQLSTAGLLIVLTVGGGLAGALLYAVTRPRGEGKAIQA